LKQYNHIDIKYLLRNIQDLIWRKEKRTRQVSLDAIMKERPTVSGATLV
jgi:hypothetical protein